MFLAQVALMFALWLGYGLLQWRRSQTIQQAMMEICRKRRAVYGPLLLLAGVAAMAGGFAVVQAMGGLTREGLTIVAWLVLALSGLLFVHLQTIGAAMMASLATAVTPCCSSPSCKCGVEAPKSGLPE
ncbi:MAG TPA: hypothetical protein VM328_03650 [Fimbriimonadaceae bacterium]|nr:hypothetical protein [Fimbriimonadaceae bacterium]